MTRLSEYTLLQKPNLPLKVWLGATVLRWIISEPPINMLLDLISFGAIFTWAWLEIFDGTNRFRKSLGVVVMIFILVSRIY